MVFLKINGPNFIRLIRCCHTKFQIGMAAAIPAIPLPAPLYAVVGYQSFFVPFMSWHYVPMSLCLPTKSCKLQGIIVLISSTPPKLPKVQIIHYITGLLGMLVGSGGNFISNTISNYYIIPNLPAQRYALLVGNIKQKIS